MSVTMHSPSTLQPTDPTPPDIADTILSYYQSASDPPSGPSLLDHGQPRAASPSTAASSTTATLRRTSIPSQGGTDRRRLAIVEMDARRPPGHDRSDSNTTRRSDPGGGPPHHSTRLLALVAPPDASPPLAPPLSKAQPSITVPNSNPCSHSDAFTPFPKPNGHVPRKSSREVAIVGTTSFPASSSVPQQSLNTPVSDSLRPPLFQIPQSRSPSPGVSDLSDSSCSTNRGRQRRDALAPGVSPSKELKELAPIRTPNMGESKHINDRVVGPVVISLLPQPPSPSPVSPSPYSSSQDLMSPRTSLSSPLTPSTALTSPITSSSSSYLHYQPGLHSTAGPLPPPPQAVFTINPKSPPPPRPPRHSPVRRKGDLEAVKQALQLPSHVAAALKAKPSPPSTAKEVRPTSLQTVSPVVPPSADSPQSSHETLDIKPHHVREGAFPPSRLCTSDPNAQHEEVATSLPRLHSMDDLVASIGLAIDDMGIMSSSDVPPPTVVEPPRGHEGQNGRKALEIRRSDNIKPSFSSEHPHIDSLPSSPRSDESVSQGWVDPDKTPAPSEETVPPVPAKNDLPHLDVKYLKNALNIKRFSSLPRTPSLLSLSRPSVASKRSSGTPSPSVAHSMMLPKRPIRKTKTRHPPAMFFADVTVKRTALERSVGYAYKINELYNCNCGLGDWIAETKYKAMHPHSAKRATVNPSRGRRAPSTSSPSIAPRHISESSTDSGVTFPIRPDAYSATDLAPRATGDASPPNAPPPLPYPALAATPRSRPSRASTMIATSSTSSGRSAISPSSKSPGNFFTSLGRKASLKREKVMSPPSLAKTLSKSPPKTVNEYPIPRRENLPPIVPSVPGGPRALPNRMQRSQTIIVSTQNSSDGTTPQRASTVTGRPSLLDGRGSTQQHTTSGAEFNRQVDKLAALLPKADRNVLAIYLRRAGQDMLAIGQYLEDEKNGTLRYD